jgi:single-stranded-DNA-specific exonuclease
LLRGAEDAALLLADAIERKRRVVVVGDFDADGATSCALAISVLRQFGLHTVDYAVPDRFKYGYGLSPAIVEVVAQRFSPDVIVTVDNGISSIDGVALAKAWGIDVVVTDHHLPGKTLPAADVIVNPNQPQCAFPSKALAGVGVMFYVLIALRALLRERAWFERQGLTYPALTDALDLVALGTVADMAPLDHVNRILVAGGLARIRAGLTRPGILGLLQVAGKQVSEVTTDTFGFVLGPRLNAAGRLDDMALGIECLLADSLDRSVHCAHQLQSLNSTRKDIETDMLRVAENQLATNLEREDLPAGLVLYDPTWHAGVVGLLASRVKDRCYRPTIAFADAHGDTAVTADDAPEGAHDELTHDELKGSARSLPGIHIRDVLDTIAGRYPDLMSRFGGHAMAAGLSLSKGALPAFRRAFSEEVQRRMGDKPLTPCLETDGELASEAITLETAEIIALGGPWGQGFPEPRFEGQFALLDQRLVGENHLKVRLGLGNRVLDGIAFRIDTDVWPDQAVRHVYTVYKLDINSFRGERRLQLIIDYLVPIAAP